MNLRPRTLVVLLIVQRDRQPAVQLRVVRLLSDQPPQRRRIRLQITQTLRIERHFVARLETIRPPIERGGERRLRHLDSPLRDQGVPQTVIAGGLVRTVNHGVAERPDRLHMLPVRDLMKKVPKYKILE